MTISKFRGIADLFQTCFDEEPKLMQVYFKDLKIIDDIFNII